VEVVHFRGFKMVGVRVLWWKNLGKSRDFGFQED